MRWSLIVVAAGLLLSACSHPADAPVVRFYEDPSGEGATASLDLVPSSTTETLSVAVYDNPDLECGRKKGYMGYRKTKGDAISMRIPAGRLIQLSPLVDESGAMCLDFIRMGLLAQSGDAYRLRYEIRRVACEPDFNAKAGDRRACQPYAPFRELCLAILEKRTDSSWVPAQGVQRVAGYNPRCAEPR